ncbi:hypothetical protein GCM10028822_00280 [Hymenobacter terrigena]
MLEITGSLAAPSLSYALMGPGQAEFTSYESPASADMVNLSTGDLTYNVPVLEVPGPETTFSLPLTYRAGIRPEQEASWVGLGWGMNPGAIVRNVNGYPDDANGELATNSYSDPGHRGWYGGVPGILNLGWDSETGHSGSASLLGFVNASWSGGKLQEGDVIGVGASRSEGAGIINPTAFISTMATLATAGIGAPLSVGASVALQAGTALATGVGIAAFGKQSPSGGGFNRPTVVKEHTWFRTNYWVFVNDTTKEAMFGSLNFDQMSAQIDPNFGDFANANNYGPNVYDGVANYQSGRSRKGYKFNYRRNFVNQGNFVTETAADMHQFTAPGLDYKNSTQDPISIAHDDFTVMGAGVSGSIRPQRLDVGSLAYPRQMLEHHDKYSLVPWEHYKVPFRYDNTASNTYTYTNNANPAATPAGIDGTHWGNSELVITDPKIYDATQNAAAVRTEPNRKGLTDRHLVQGKQVDWFTNKEIADAYDNTPVTYPIAEFGPPVRDTKTREVIVGYHNTRVDHQIVHEPIYQTQSITSNNFFRKIRPENGIGAFAVTAEDGTTYHYSLPVYHFRQFSHTEETAGSNKGVAVNRTGASGNEGFNYATAWLLTAITSPDYVDQGTLGVVDDQDLGTWVAFSYGKFSNQFKWRQPYVGTEHGPASQNSATYQEGAKETYYLNTIRTRTHTAVFIKSVRQDGHGHYTLGATSSSASISASNLGIDERTPSSSLRLDEIVVLSNKELQEIKTTTGFSENTNNNADTQNATLGGNDSFANVFDQNDLTAVAAIRSTLNQKALKRVVFNYSYRLCPGTPNSFSSATLPPALGATYTALNRKGKLTLESIATYGPNSVKLIPDFRFDYGNNPAYAPDKWDGFGMYASTGTATSHRPSTSFAVASQDGAAWSLTKITNPLGAVTDIAYERDQYASVSEYYNGSYGLTDQGTGGPNGLLMGDNSLDLTTIYHVGQVIHVKGRSWENYQVTETPVDENGNPNDRPNTSISECPVSFYSDYTIVSITRNSIQLDSPPPAPNSCPDGVPPDNRFYHYSGGDAGYGGCTASITVPMNQNGGDIRVASLTTRDESAHAYTIKYQYTNSRTAGGNSTGVISKEPEYIKQGNYNVPDNSDIYILFDYPATPVMYGQTTVLRGNFTTPTDIDQREEYAFYTANSSMVTPTKTIVDTRTNYYPYLNDSGDILLRQLSNLVSVDIGLLGQAKSIRKFNRRGTLEFSTVFNYATALPNADGIASQGTYSESALTSEFLDVDNTKSTGALYNVNWTTKQYLPTTLLGTTTTTNNIAATTTNQVYDFYTGAVLESSLTNSIGDRYRTKTVPAYTIYAGMGPKTEGVGNRHMLTQMAATYSFKENGTATPSVLGAGIQTWNNAWTTYRQYDAASDRYLSDPGANVPIWRQHRTYAWQSPQLHADGTYANFVDYNWAQTAQAANWLNVGEVTLYDHYSRPLESKDLNGQYASLKVGYDKSQVLAAAQNARYTEIAYSGAEDVQSVGTGTSHFGGEVRDGGRQSPLQHHTGLYSSLLTSTAPLGFTYKALVGNANDLSTDRTYRASVWVHTSDTQGNARLYVALNGATVKEVSSTDPTTRRAGGWYLLNLYVDLPASTTGQQLTVGCRNAGSADVYVDDFRFHPLDAPLNASVYDVATRQPTFTLNNDNLYTRYEYDAAGRVVKVYKEVLTPGNSSAPAERLLKESSYNYAEMRTPNWLDVGTECATNAAGQRTGYLAHRLRDVNTASPTYNQEQVVATTELSPTCP